MPDFTQNELATNYPALYDSKPFVIELVAAYFKAGRYNTAETFMSGVSYGLSAYEPAFKEALHLQQVALQYWRNAMNQRLNTIAA